MAEMTAQQEGKQMPRNTLGDLNNHLFEQIERLNDESLDEKALDNEIRRSKAMAGIASTIIQNAEIILEAQKFGVEYMQQKELPLLLKG